MKFNMAYRRFRHFGKDKVTMDFAFFAIAFNIKKMCSKIAKQTKNGGNTPHTGLFLLISRFYRLRIGYFGIILKYLSPETSKPQCDKKRGCAVKLNYDTASYLYISDQAFSAIALNSSSDTSLASTVTKFFSALKNFTSPS